MKEKELINKLNKYQPQPDKVWQDGTLNILKSLPEIVTNKNESRISFINLFYFLYQNIMNLKLKLGVVIALSVALIGGSFVTVYASNDANPGDFLFPLDKALEQVERSIITDPIAKAEFEIKVMDERISELEKLSGTDDDVNASTSVGEIEEQQIRLQERLMEMNQLRLENKLQTQEQLKLLEQLKTQTRINEGTMNQIQQELQQNGNSSALESLARLQLEYSKQMGEQISGFEESTGLNVQEAEQNAGEDSQIQNQNQIQNGLEKVKNGLTTLEELLRVANPPYVKK